MLGLKQGTVLAERYRIERVVGEGGMSTVYLATHLSLGNPVAVKELRMPPSDEDKRAARIRQFQREARILSALKHDNLVPVHDFFEGDGSAYLVMDYLTGCTLQQLVDAQGMVAEPQVLEWTRQLCDVLEYLHAQPEPVIFRDLKPGNIMVLEDGRLKLIDFGIAKTLTPAHEQTTHLAHGAGTAGFAALEQYSGTTDARTDIYGLGATLYCLLTGEAPPWSVVLATGMATVKPIQSSNPEVSKQTASAIDWMLYMDPAKRPQSVAQARSALFERVEAPALPTPDASPPVGTSPWVLLAGALVFAGITGGGLWAGARLLNDHGVAPSPPTTRLSVATQPDGAEVFINDAPRGQTPLDLSSLDPGTYRLRVTHEGYVQRAEEVTVESGQSLKLSLSLVPVSHVEAPPVAASSLIDVSVRGTSGARMTVDGVPLGTVPRHVGLVPGEHRFRVSKRGFETRTESIEVLSGPPTVVTLELRRPQHAAVTPQPDMRPTTVVVMPPPVPAVTAAAPPDPGVPPPVPEPPPASPLPQVSNPTPAPTRGQAGSGVVVHERDDMRTTTEPSPEGGGIPGLDAPAPTTTTIPGL